MHVLLNVHSAHWANASPLSPLRSWDNNEMQI